MPVLRPAFRGRDDGGVSVRLPAWVRAMLGRQFEELAGLLSTGARPASDDPLEALTGMSATVREAPDDPVLQRLRPDGYAADVDEGVAAADFRRFTEADLEALQRQRVSSVRESLTSGDRFELDAAAAQDWLGALNDLRLALGTRLEVTEDPEEWPDQRDPRAGGFEAYALLGHLQHLLLVALGAPADY